MADLDRAEDGRGAVVAAAGGDDVVPYRTAGRDRVQDVRSVASIADHGPGRVQEPQILRGRVVLESLRAQLEAGIRDTERGQEVRPWIIAEADTRPAAPILAARLSTPHAGQVRAKDRQPRCSQPAASALIGPTPRSS